MNKKISNAEFRESLDRRLSSLQPDPWLAKRVIASGKEEKKVKKLSGFTIVVVVILALSMATALAAALGGLNISDFWLWRVENEEMGLPENYEEAIRTADITVEKDYAVFTVPGYYYDGNMLTMIVNVFPRVDALPIGAFWWDANTSMEDSYYRTAVTEETTAGEYALKRYGGQVAGFRAGIDSGDGAFHPDNYSECYSAVAETLNEDGSLTFLLEEDLDAEGLQEKEISLVLSYTKAIVSENETGLEFIPQEEDYTVIPLTVRASETKQYVCEEELDFPSVGAKLTRITLTVTPMEILCALDGEVTDAEVFKARRENLGFEFLYPDDTAPDAERRVVLPGAVGSMISTISTSYVSSGSAFRSEMTINLDALGDRYTIRAFDFETHEIFETATFAVSPAEE